VALLIMGYHPMLALPVLRQNVASEFILTHPARGGDHAALFFTCCCCRCMVVFVKLAPSFIFSFPFDVGLRPMRLVRNIKRFFIAGQEISQAHDGGRSLCMNHIIA
jgi:hypothetical protein